MNNYLNKFSLYGKVSFVTGGAGLIGSEIVKALADAGSKVIILEIDQARVENLSKKLKKKGLDVYSEIFDTANLSQIDTEIEKLFKKYGRLDVWVNAAYPRTSDWGNKVEDISINSWQKNVDMHLNSYSWISRKVCLIMKKHKYGSLINFGSIYGVVGNDFTIYEGTKINPPMAYSAIKGGIISLSRYLASYFGKYNVRVNTICPGGVFNNQHKNFVQKYSCNTPLKRMGKPDEIASAVLFLASDASSYITGSTLMVDGGWTAV